MRRPELASPLHAPAAGVSAGIDLALTLASTIAGDALAQSILLGMAYKPRPPFDARTPKSAPPEIVAVKREPSRFAPLQDEEHASR